MNRMRAEVKAKLVCSFCRAAYYCFLLPSHRWIMLVTEVFS